MMNSNKIILHLCADIGSDTRPYALAGYDVRLIGEQIGVEIYTPPSNVYGIIANPVCTEFSTAKGFHKPSDMEKGMFLVNHCLRIIKEANHVFWALENPYNGRLKDRLGAPKLVYQPWQYGSPWTKKTALWGNFNPPKPIYDRWEDLDENPALYVWPTRGESPLAFLHKSAADVIAEFRWAKDKIKTDADLHSMCSQGFAHEFYKLKKYAIFQLFICRNDRLRNDGRGLAPAVILKTGLQRLQAQR